MRNAGLDEPQAGIRFAGRNISNLRYANDTTLMAESELKSLLLKVRVGLKLNIQKTKIRASGLIAAAAKLLSRLSRVRLCATP